MVLYKIFYLVAIMTTLVILYFLFVGLGDGTVNNRNYVLWFVMVAACAGVLAGSPWLRSHGQPILGLVVLALLAVPALLFGLFFLVIILSGAKWN